MAMAISIYQCFYYALCICAIPNQKHISPMLGHDASENDTMANGI